MASAKDIRVERINPQAANAFVRVNHYSGKVVPNSQLHFGAFLNGRLHGVMSFGPSLDKKKMQGIVRDTPWNGFIELNRMAFDDVLPRNSESRVIGVVMRLLRKHVPHLQWIISFADATQCGSGTIYRASGFDLVDIRESKNLCRLKTGEVIHKMTLESNPTAPRPELNGKSYYDVTGGRFHFRTYVEHTGATVLPGYQIKYLYFLDPSARERLTMPILPFSALDDVIFPDGVKHSPGVSATAPTPP